jgi:hypothetical protein
MFEYDEDVAVRFITNHLPEETRAKFPSDTLYYMLDLMAEFYETQDWMEEEDEEREERELIRFLIHNAQKDSLGHFSESDIRLLLAVETAYTDTLDIP